MSGFRAAVLGEQQERSYTGMRKGWDVRCIPPPNGFPEHAERRGESFHYLQGKYEVGRLVNAMSNMGRFDGRSHTMQSSRHGEKHERIMILRSLIIARLNAAHSVMTFVLRSHNLS